MASKKPLVIKSTGRTQELTAPDIVDSALLDPTLTALAAYNTNGLVTQTAPDTFTGRALTGTTDQISITNGSGVAGDPTVGIASNPILPGTGGATLPTGTTAQRAGVDGTIRYNTTVPTVEARINGTWTSLASGGTVTSVAQSLTGLSFLSLSGSPITTAGTLALSADCASGDLIYGSASNALSKLTIGGANKILAVSASLPSWQNGWMGVTALTANTTLTVASGTLQTIDTSGGAVTVTLPDAATSSGKVFAVKKIAGSNAATLQRAGSDTIDGSNSVGFSASLQNQSILIESDGTTTWRILSPLGSGLLSNARYTSSAQIITAGGSLTLAHGLPSTPRRIWYDLECVTAELGYTAGQRIAAQAVTGKNGAGPGMAIVADSTSINIRYNNGSPVFQVCRYDTGAQVNITNANWGVVFYAEL